MATRPIYFMDYDKISDVLMYLGADMTLKFNVQLAYTDKNGSRRFFHRETKKSSNNCNSNVEYYSIKRDMNFYFSIDNTKDFRCGTMINMNDIYVLQRLMDTTVLPWLFDGNTFIKSPDNPSDISIAIDADTEPKTYLLPNDKYIQFAPIVYKNDYTNTTDIGIRMTVCRPEYFCDMDYGKFLTFYNLLTKTDVYTLASTMLTYAKTEPYGTNVYTPSNGREGNNNFFNNL